MTDPAMLKARELAAAVSPYADGKAYFTSGSLDAHCAMIALAKREREFSDAVEAWAKADTSGELLDAVRLLRSFILRKPKPDPMGVLADALPNIGTRQELAAKQIAALTAAGLQITEIEPCSGT